MDVFRRNRAGTIGGFCYAYVKISELKVEKDGVDLLSIIPVLDFSVRPCFYNQAPSAVPATDPSRYFYNQGTGEFTWGELD